MSVDDIRSDLMEILNSNNFSNEHDVEFDKILRLIEAKDTLQNEVGITLTEIDEKIEDIDDPIIESVEGLRNELEELQSDIESALEDTSVCKGQQRKEFNTYVGKIGVALIYIEGDEVDSLMQGVEDIKVLFGEDEGIKSYIKKQPKRRFLSQEESQQRLLLEDSLQNCGLSSFSSVEKEIFINKILSGRNDFTEKELLAKRSLQKFNLKQDCDLSSFSSVEEEIFLDKTLSGFKDYTEKELNAIYNSKSFKRNNDVF